MSNSLVHLARLNHPSHLALGFGRAILKTNIPNKSPFKVSLQERKFKGQTETGRLKKTKQTVNLIDLAGRKSKHFKG